MRSRARAFLLSCLAAIGCSTFMPPPSLAADASGSELERLVTDPALVLADVAATAV